jgi:hypothetical protein
LSQEQQEWLAWLVSVGALAAFFWLVFWRRSR